MRIIGDVINAIKKETPKEWQGYSNFIKGLDNVIDSANYRAPEAYVVNFEQLAQVLGDHLGEPDTEWKQTIADIFADKVDVGIRRFEE